MGDLANIGTIDVHGEDLGNDAVSLKMPPENALAVRHEKRPAIVTGIFGEALLAGAIGVHDVDLAEVSGILFVNAPFLGRKMLERKGITERSEDDLFSVG